MSHHAGGGRGPPAHDDNEVHGSSPLGTGSSHFGSSQSRDTSVVPLELFRALPTCCNALDPRIVKTEPEGRPSGEPAQRDSGRPNRRGSPTASSSTTGEAEGHNSRNPVWPLPAQQGQAIRYVYSEDNPMNKYSRKRLLKLRQNQLNSETPTLIKTVSGHAGQPRGQPRRRLKPNDTMARERNTNRGMRAEETF